MPTDTPNAMLAWRECNAYVGSCLMAKTPFGIYWIDRVASGAFDVSFGDTVVGCHFPDLPSARAACEADYERRCREVGLVPATIAFQDRVQPWMMACFGAEISADRVERGDRLLEEVLELLQSGGYDPARVLALRDYVWSRDAGEPAQEAGGVMVTLAAYCLAHDLDMHQAGETELARIWTKVEKIRQKQAAKPTGSALPVALTATPLAPTPAAPAVSADAIRAEIARCEADKQHLTSMLGGAGVSDHEVAVLETWVAAYEEFAARLTALLPKPAGEGLPSPSPAGGAT